MSWSAGCRASDAGGGRFDFSRWGNVGLREVPPLWLLKYLPNMAPAHVGIAHDARGPSNSIVAGETSGLLAIIEAADVVARGHADVMLAGGVSSTIAMMDVDVARRGAAVAPRRRARTGEPAVRRRSRRLGGRRGRRHLRAGAPRACRKPAACDRWRGCSATAGGTSRVRIWRSTTGQAIQQAIEADAWKWPAPRRRTWATSSAHGMSTELDDRIEAQAIRATLGDVPVTAPKSFFGNIGAGGGASSWRVTLLGLERGLIPPTLNYETPDPDVPRQRRRRADADPAAHRAGHQPPHHRPGRRAR